MRSLVTVCRAPTQLPVNLFKVLYTLTSWRPPARFQPLEVRRLLRPDQVYALRPEDNDGVVNSVSMAWPDVDASRVVEADHADVMGHFRYNPPPRLEDGVPGLRQYDLLNSPSGFTQESFEALWRNIGAFALAVAESPARPEPPELEARH